MSLDTGSAQGSIATVIGARWRSVERIYQRKWGWVVGAGASMLAILGYWRDENPNGWQPPFLADVLALLPWWAWVILAIITVLAVTFEGAHRYIHELVEPDLHWEWRGASSWGVQDLPEWGWTRTFLITDLALMNESNRKLILRLRVRVQHEDSSTTTINAMHDCQQNMVAKSPEGRLDHLPADIELEPGEYRRGHAEFREVAGLGEASVKELLSAVIEAVDVRTKRRWEILWHREPAGAVPAGSVDELAMDRLLTLAERSQGSSEPVPRA